MADPGQTPPRRLWGAGFLARGPSEFCLRQSCEEREEPLRAAGGTPSPVGLGDLLHSFEELNGQSTCAKPDHLPKPFSLRSRLPGRPNTHGLLGAESGLSVPSLGRVSGQVWACCFHRNHNRVRRQAADS